MSGDGLVLTLARLGYEPIFMDRQMLIRILYENLKDKSRVLASIKVSRVEQGSNGVKVETKDGPNYTGEILVGADGIHSAVRREMWRLADDEQPGAFPIREREEVSTEYRCIFGISKTSDKFQAFSAQYIMGEGHSYLVTSAPGNRIYWFLFKRLNKAVRGLYEKIPRYTEAERDAMAEQHANDALGDGLCFGELYRLRIAATLQALPEVVFSKWHYGRIITIGDAAHKVKSPSYRLRIPIDTPPVQPNQRTRRKQRSRRRCSTHQRTLQPSHRQ